MPAIKVNARRQVNSNWCWATCAQMVMETYGYETGTSQSAVVKVVNAGHIGNEQGSLREVGGAVSKLTNKAVAMEVVERALTLDEVNQAAQATCLVVADIGGHAVLVQGCGMTSRTLRISDPGDPPTAIDGLGASFDYETFAKKWKTSTYVTSWKSAGGGTNNTKIGGG